MKRISRRAAGYSIGVVSALLAVVAVQSGRSLQEAHNRRELFRELRPVHLDNCQLKRFGEPNDGGYALCANLLDSVQEGYSYGIGGFDQWGCDVSLARHIPVHEYDCFNTTPPRCLGGQLIFHAECVGLRAEVVNGRRYDSIQGQFAKNGSTAKHLVVKMDVEGAEWSSLAVAPDSVLEQIDQLVVEFHTADQSRFLPVIARLKQHFVPVHIHFNNFGCRSDQAPFPSIAYEVLFVNKALAHIGPGGPAADANVDAPNDPNSPDCQSPAGA